MWNLDSFNPYLWEIIIDIRVVYLVIINIKGGKAPRG